ncbi:50S ribosomal protein L23 [Marinobacter algicola DG893]|uniref:50S ribosomal protein L23 n=1 Tax=Marinobacter algicola DG893 TaxID=443152 RepID=A6F171_9GAMM|nr:50S ribosomal protein L23 [Marinobacter algicola DG893]
MHHVGAVNVQQYVVLL